MAEKTSKYNAEVQLIEYAEDFEDYRGSAFAKLSVRGFVQGGEVGNSCLPLLSR